MTLRHDQFPKFEHVFSGLTGAGLKVASGLDGFDDLYQTADALGSACDSVLVIVPA